MIKRVLDKFEQHFILVLCKTKWMSDSYYPLVMLLKLLSSLFIAGALEVQHLARPSWFWIFLIMAPIIAILM